MLTYFDYVFTTIFAMEVIVKVIYLISLYLYVPVNANTMQKDRRNVRELNEIAVSETLV